MKIPKYIDKLLDKRAKAAQQLMECDSIITDWIVAHEIEAEDCDYCTGVEMYANPYASADRIREAILNKE